MTKKTKNKKLGESVLAKSKKDIIFISFIIVWTLIVALSVFVYLDNKVESKTKSVEAQLHSYIEEKEKAEEDAQKKEEESLPFYNIAEDSALDMSDWKYYSSNYYGFELNYPQTWLSPKVTKGSANVKWDYQYEFRAKNSDAIESNQEESDEESQKDQYVGFDIKVYPISEVRELTYTEEYPYIKRGVVGVESKCEALFGHIAENEKYLAEQIYVPSEDDCYQSAYFYTLIGQDYIYTISPVSTGQSTKELHVYKEEEILEQLPELTAAASTFNLIEIVRPKPVPAAPKPVSYKKDALGRLVCASDNDNPGYSKQGKDLHLDMQCCLDPDEYPNPWCYYPADKYGDLLKTLPRWPGR